METTGTLRNRLGFTDAVIWKQFCSRRLQLIHSLSLNLRKASEQEEQVKALASELCAEYSLPESCQPDFEKLLIAGIQSVRRNQKRSSRQAVNIPKYTSESASLSGLSNGDARRDSHDDNWRYGDSDTYLSSSNDSISSLPDRLSNPHFAQRPSNNLVHSLTTRIAVIRDLVKSSTGSRLDNAMPASVKASAYGILSIAVSTAVMNAKLSNYAAIEFNEAIWSGPLLDSLRDVIDHRLTRDRLFECMGSLAASLVHGPSFLGALQALFVCLVQVSHGSVPRMIQVLRQIPVPEHARSSISSSSTMSSRSSVDENMGADDIVPSAMSVSGPDKQVTLRFNDRFLKMIYSPLKATPPTVGEIIDTGRQLFDIPPSSVVRIRDSSTGKIIESNAELIDSFSLPEIFLELIVPPPMLLETHKIQPNPMDVKFTPLAPLIHPTDN